MVFFKRSFFFWLSFAALLAYLAISFSILNNGMLHEDAFILFKYVNNFVNFGAVSYSPQLGPAEGATDFLWFLLLSALVYIGFLPGVAAVVLSLVGLLLIFYSGNKLLFLLSGDVDREHRWGFVFFVFGVTFSTISAASFGGFSALFYCGFVALGFYFSFSGSVAKTIWIGLVLCLIRPDGLIMAFGLFLMALFMAKKEENFFKVHLLWAVAIGIFYFILRWSYFELPLPLPLMVKSHTSEFLDGMHDVSKVLKYIAPIIIVYAVFVLKINKNYLWALFPIAIFSIPFIFVHLSQNIAFRFQAPLVVIAWLLFMVLYAQKASSRNFVIYLAFIPLVAFGVKNIIQQYERLTKFEYINTFSPVMAKYIIGETIALTESGRLPYYSNALFYDLVGLNNKQAAISRVDLSMIQGWNPGLIFIHPANALSVKSKCISGYENLSVNDIIPNDALRGKSDKVTQAAFAAYDFFVRNKNSYDFYAVRFDEGCNHFYFLRSGSDLLSNFESVIKYSVDKSNKLNYFSSEKYNISSVYIK